MKAILVPTKAPVPPFGDAMGDVLVLDRPLAEVRQEALDAAGLTLVDAPPNDEPYLAMSDRIWATAACLRKIVDAGVGRTQIIDAHWLQEQGDTHDRANPGVLDIGVFPARSPPVFDNLSPVSIDLGLEPHELEGLHPAMVHAARPVLAGPAQVVQIEHWTHILLANRLALGQLAEDVRQQWNTANILSKIWRVLRLVFRVRSLDKWVWARRLCEVGQDCEIHPTAVVELSRLGNNVKVGPHAVVRGAFLADGAEVGEFATVSLSVMGQGTQLGRYGFLNLSVLYPGAMVSKGDGYQASLFGRDSFMAWGATALDLSFGRTIPVWMRGKRRDSGQHFLGVCIGHRARVMNGVRLGYGMDVPNDAMIVADAGTLLRDWNQSPTDQMVRVEDGKAVPVKPAPTPQPDPEEPLPSR